MSSMLFLVGDTSALMYVLALYVYLSFSVVTLTVRSIIF